VIARRRTVAVLAAVALGSLALLTYLTNRLATDAVEGQIGGRLQATAHVGADRIQSELGGVRRLVEAYGDRVLLRRAVSGRRLTAAERIARIDRHLRGLHEAHPDIRMAAALDAGGTLLSARPAGQATLAKDFSVGDDRRGDTAGRRSTISDVFRAAASGERLVAVSVGVRGAPRTPDANRRIGALVVAYRTRGIQQLTDRADRDLGVTLEVTDDRGAVVAGPRLHQSGGRSGAPMLAARAPVRDLRWTMAARVSKRAAYADVRDLRLTVFGIGGVLGIVVLAGLLLVARLLRRDGGRAKALADRERATQAMIDASYAAFIAADGDGHITEWNAQAEKLFGWSCTEAGADPPPELIVPAAGERSFPQLVRDLVAERAQPADGARVELLARHRSGRTFPVEAALWRSEAGGTAVVHAFVHDISERKRTEDELGVSRDDAVAASRMKSEFLANMSHEIRTPMNGVIGMAELLLESDLPERQREFATTIASSGEALLSIIDDILDFSKIEAGKLEIEASDFALVPLIADVCELLAPRADAKGVELTCHVTDEVPDFASGDHGRLRQVLTNLIGNAVKFTDAGEVAVAASRPVAGTLAVQVSDTGAGIDADRLDALFEPFSQADASMTRRHAGTGLGLTISRQLVELMGGTISVESTRYVGSTFRVELPLPTSFAPEAVERRGAAALAGARILAVDDHATNRRIIDAHLRAADADLVLAADGAHGLAALDAATAAGRPFDVVVLDMKMPDINGDEVARIMRADPRHDRTPILLLSSTRVDAVPTDRLQPCASMRKPLRRARLLDAVGALLDVAATEGVLTKAAPPPPSHPGARVLLVEDNVVNQAVVVEMLTTRGDRVDVADDGAAAITAFERESFDLVLMDCQMPEMDGYQVTAKLRALEATSRRSTPIVAMTASSMAGDRERCIAAGMDDYLSKPFRRSQLDDVLVRWSGAALPHDGRPAWTASATGARTAVHELFHADAAKRLDELRDAGRRQDAESVRRAAHALRGASSMIGALAVADICARIESAGRTGELTGVLAAVDQLERALAQLALATQPPTPVCAGSAPG
jgi:PAS domain S-box-containing protein